MKDKKPIFGIDEAGRGPIAGPVAVGVFKSKLNNKDVRKLIKKTKVKLQDSKKLTYNQREAWLEQIKKWKKEEKCDFAVTLVSEKIIDKYGIIFAINKALKISLYKLKPKVPSVILLDGGLKAPKEFYNQKTIIKGDEKEIPIMLASIVAKVTRDAYMEKQAELYPEYDFERHKGYGTPKHYLALKRYGLTPLHRKSFLRSL